MTDFLIGVEHTAPGWLVNIIFLGEAEAAIRSSIKSRFDIVMEQTWGRSNDLLLPNGPPPCSLKVPPPVLGSPC